MGGEWIRLASGGIHAPKSPRCPLTIRCTVGVLWITQTGNPLDILLHPGGVCTLAVRGKIVVQSLQDSVFSIEMSR